MGLRISFIPDKAPTYGTVAIKVELWAFLGGKSIRDIGLLLGGPAGGDYGPEIRRSTFRARRSWRRAAEGVCLPGALDSILAWWRDRERLGKSLPEISDFLQTLVKHCPGEHGTVHVR